jgi:hypothetical protein
MQSRHGSSFWHANKRGAAVRFRPLRFPKSQWCRASVQGAGNGGQVERVPETGTGRISRKLGRFWGWSCYQRARRFCRAGERIKHTGEVLKRDSRRRQFTLQFLRSLCSHAARNQRALQEPSLQIYQLDPGDVHAVPGTDAAFQRSAAQRPGSSRPVAAKCFKGFHNPNFPK